MGTFSAKMRIWNPANPASAIEVEAMVDTGASLSWIHRERLEKMGIAPMRKMGFRAIDGSIMERDLAPVWVASNGFEAPDIVVVAERSDMEVIGARTLEGLGLAADPAQKKLVPTIGLALVTRGDCVRAENPRPGVKNR